MLSLLCSRIDLSFNRNVAKTAGLTGTVSASFGGISKLQYLALNGNLLSGSIPAELAVASPASPAATLTALQ